MDQVIPLPLSLSLCGWHPRSFALALGLWHGICLLNDMHGAVIEIASMLLKLKTMVRCLLAPLLPLGGPILSAA